MSRSSRIKRSNRSNGLWSVVIPAFNEAKRLPKTLKAIDRYGRKRPGGEVIVVDDGSKDQTAQNIEIFQRTSSLPVKFLKHPVNLGKGAAVRSGVAAAQGEVILFMDADGSMAIDDLDKLTGYLKDCDIAIGSKYLNPSTDTRRQELPRTALAFAGKRIVKLLFGLDFSDTQCGFKVFRGRVARELFSKMRTNRWAFDIELLALAKRQGFRIKEVGLNWVNTDDSRVNLIPAAWTTFWEILQIRINLWLKN